MILKQKNSLIELERFLACTAIFFFHWGFIFTSGWIFVEFFYILTGYFSLRHFSVNISKYQISDRQYANDAFKYCIKKFVQLFPFIGCSMLLTAIINITDGKIYNIKQLVIYAIIFFENLFGLTGYSVLQRNIVINEYYTYEWMIDGIFWYTAALFVALPIFLWSARKIEQYVGIWTFTALPTLIYGLCIVRYNSFSGWSITDPFLYIMLNFRALAGLLLGGAVYKFSEFAKKNVTCIKKSLKNILSILEILLFVMAIILSTTVGVPLDMMIVIMFVLSLTLTTSGLTNTNIVHNKFLDELGSIAMPVFCLQYPVCNIVNRMITITERWQSLGVNYIILVIISWILVKTISKPWDVLTKKIYNIDGVAFTGENSKS